MSTLQNLNLNFENAETKLLVFLKKIMTFCPAEQPGAHICIFCCIRLLQRLSVSRTVRGSFFTQMGLIHIGLDPGDDLNIQVN